MQDTTKFRNSLVIIPSHHKGSYKYENPPEPETNYIHQQTYKFIQNQVVKLMVQDKG